nr:MAG TPA: hypothetical protein [Crassvirales sp.]
MTDKHDEQLLGFSNLNKIFPIVDVVDNLNSDITNRPLSAKQGKTLKEMINGITSFNYEIVTELPAVGQKGVIYLILNSASTEENNIYDEYLYVNDKYEKLGSFTTQIDLSQIKDELFFDFDIDNAFNRVNGESGTVKDEYYNKLLEAINNNKIIKYNEVIFNTVKYNTDESGQSFVIEMNFHSNQLGTVVITIDSDKTFTQKLRGDTYFLNVDSLNQSTWENINEIEQNLAQIVYIKFDDGTCSPSLYTHIKLHNFGKVYKFIYADADGYLHKLSVTNPDTTADKIQFTDEKFIIYANNDTAGNILLGYKANANNYPLQVDTEHRAFVNIPEKKYELDINPFVQKPKGTITVEKYNEIYAAIKDGKSIYTQGLLSNAFDTGSGVAIYMNIIYIKGWLIIDNTGAYYIVPDSIDLEYNHYGYFETQYLYIFEDEDLLKLVNNIVIHNYGDKEVVIEITDYEKKGNTITFKLCKNRNYYYPCSFTIGDNNLDITGGEFFYASNLNPGVIGINYEQNGQNYPVKVDELGNAFVNVPSEGRYDLDVSFLSNGFRGTISTDKYNELANAIKDANENNILIYMSGILVNCAVDDSSITIFINSIDELDGALLINNIGEYIFIPKNIELTPGRYKFTTQFAYIFEYQNYLNSLVHNIYIIDNKDNKHTVVSIKDYNKTSDSISFKLVLSNLFYHKCSIDLTNKNRNELDNYEDDYIFPTENGDDAGIIKLGYTQNDKNYPLQINEDGQAFVNVPWSGSTYNNATQTSDGLMSKEDKTKLDGLTGAATKILSQSEYDSLTNKDENTVYFIKG